MRQDQAWMWVRTVSPTLIGLYSAVLEEDTQWYELRILFTPVRIASHPGGEVAVDTIVVLLKI